MNLSRKHKKRITINIEHNWENPEKTTFSRTITEESFDEQQRSYIEQSNQQYIITDSVLNVYEHIKARGIVNDFVNHLCNPGLFNQKTCNCSNITQDRSPRIGFFRKLLLKLRNFKF